MIRYECDVILAFLNTLAYVRRSSIVVFTQYRWDTRRIPRIFVNRVRVLLAIDLNYERAYKHDGRFPVEIELKTPERIFERSTVGDSNTNFKRYL